MDQAEASGKTVEDALNRALAILGARRDEVEFTVLDEGAKGGLFKRGRDAIVRVDRIAGQAAPVASPREAPDTRIPHGPQNRGGAPRGGQNRERTGDRPPRQPSGDRPPRDRDRGGERGGGGGRDRGGRGGRLPLETATPKLTEQDFLRPRGEAPAETAPDTSAPSPRGQRGGRGRGPGGDRPDRGNGGDRPERGSGGEQPPSRPRGERRERREFEPEGNIVPDINAEEVDFAAQTVDDILRLLDIDASLNIREPITPGDGLGMALAVIDISGDDLGLLIGRRGDTLLSLQYVVNLIVSRRYPGKGGVTIDVEHYRHRREEQVVSLAQRMAERVREHGSPITLEPMSAAERRLVHLALAEDAELETNSIGEGENRKVVISRR
jgi:spoIIIJ-associated protein